VTNPSAAHLLDFGHNLKNTCLRASFVLTLAATTLLLRPTSVAHACGVPAPGAPVLACSAEPEGEDEEPAPKFRFALGLGQSSTTITFDGDRYDVQRTLALVSAERQLGERLTLQASFAVIPNGLIVSHRDRTARYETSFGGTGGIGVSYRVLDEDLAAPFVVLGANLGYLQQNLKGLSAAATGSSLSAFDLRLSLVFGKTFWDRLSVYGVGRVFGGPVAAAFTDARGTDIYKYQVGIGTSLRLGARLDFFGEGIFVGERYITAGLGLRL
jgi:hypothetical protein